MAKRMVLMLAAVALFVGGIGFFKYMQIEAAMSRSGYQPPPEAVTTLVAKSEPWEQTLAAIGTVTAVNGVMVSADLPGIVEKITFDSGRTVKAGEVLVTLDTRQEKAQLAWAEAQRELANLNLERNRGLREQGITAQADMDQAAANAKQAEAQVGEIRATIERKVIQAPFSGILGIRQVNLGQYLKGGDPVVPLQSLDPIHVDFSVPQEKMAQAQVGREVRVAQQGTAASGLEGKVTAVDSVIDPATRNVQIQATFANPEGRLRPGMFVKVQVVLPEKESTVSLPISSVRYAPYGNSIFIVEEMKDPKGQAYKGVRQQFVKLGSERGDLIEVLSGVKAGEEVVTSGVFKLRNGAAVLVNNDVKPGDNPAPKPEDS
jgi:membrane fusion protein (multidrug efflux system)